MKVVIMAGGEGRRIRDVYPDLPKPMIRIAGMPVLERTIYALRKYGVREFIITISYQSDKIEQYFGDGSGISAATGKTFGVHIKHFKEDNPMGNAGALLAMREEFDSDFLLLNGDLIFDIDLNQMTKFHIKHNALATLFTHPNNHPFDSGLLITDEDQTVLATPF